MQLAELYSLIRKGESTNLEFKKSTLQLKSACATVCAFLNNHSGQVIIGVNMEGELVGQDVTENMRREIASELNKIKPAVQVGIHYIPIDDKNIIIFNVPRGSQGPYFYAGRPYQREQLTTRRISPPRYSQVLSDRSQPNK